MIEKEQREVERRPITKITHKGEIEIENQEPAKTPEAIEVEVRFGSNLISIQCNLVIFSNKGIRKLLFLSVFSQSRC